MKRERKPKGVGIHCESCGVRTRVPASYAGKRGLCPRCHAVVRVPTLEEARRARKKRSRTGSRKSTPANRRSSSADRRGSRASRKGSGTRASRKGSGTRASRKGSGTDSRASRKGSGTDSRASRKGSGTDCRASHKDSGSSADRCGSEPEKQEILKVLQERRLHQLMALAPAFPVALFFKLSKRGDESVSFLESSPEFMFVATLILVAYVGFHFWNWRCPSCNTWLGKKLWPTACGSCGEVFAKEA